MPKKTDVIEVDGGMLQLIGKVRSFDGDIGSFKSRIKNIKEHMDEIIESLPEGEAVTVAKERLGVAVADLKRRLQGHSEFLKLSEDLADEKLSLKDAQDNLSEFLLGYFHDTGEKQIELAPGNGREVVLKGKLGKAKDFQTNLFSLPPVSGQERNEREE